MGDVRTVLLTGAAMAAILCAAAPAAAQTAPASSPATTSTAPAAADPAQTPAAPAAQGDAGTAPQPDANNGEVIVTGSRVALSGYTAPTPTKVLSAEQFNDRGLANIGDFLQEIPSFRPSQTAQTNPQNALGGGQNFADLRALGSTRTLTLVDGRRFVPSSATGQVDLNLIPSILISRVDVVTGGASAAYGSDAVSGVVNIILDKKLKGFKADISSGISEQGDAPRSASASPSAPASRATAATSSSAATM